MTEYLGDESQPADASLRARLVKALIGAGAVLLLVVAVAGVSLGVVRERQGAIVDVLFHAISDADNQHIALLDAEASVRGYLETGNPIALETFVRLATDDSERVDVESLLVAELGDDHVVVRARREAAAALRAWYFDFAQPLVETVAREGAGRVSVDEARAGEAAFAEADTLMRVYSELLRDERRRVVADLDTATEVLTIAFALLVAAAMGAAVLLWVFVQRWVTGPLIALVGDVREVAAGETEHPVTATGPGEVGQVARDVEQMRSRLTLLLAEAAETRDELEASHTELAASHAELAASHAELAASHAELAEQAEELRRSNRDLEQFAYVASHDLQEPLRKVASFTQLLSSRYAGELDERADQYIAFAVDGATRMQRLISDLLGFSRVGRIGGEVTWVDVGSVLDEATRDLEELIHGAGATVTASPLPTVRGERPLLVQLLRNVIGNAVKFRHPDRPSEIHLDARRVGQYWEFACRDNGIGIDPQYADRVFVIFQRLHARDVYDGTGIGLAVCKKIIEYHGGDIWVDPETRDGTTVRWTLPVGENAGTLTRKRVEEEQEDSSHG